MTLEDASLFFRRRHVAVALILWAALIGALPIAPPALAQTATATIADFRGSWVGHTVPGAPVDRAVTVLIQTRRNGAFDVTWTSIEAERQVGKPRKAIKRERTLRFEPGRRPGLWRAAGSGDPFHGFSAWARIRGRTLSINVVAVAEDGELEQQIYDRSLTDQGMRLNYRRLENGVETRAFAADFLKP